MPLHEIFRLHDVNVEYESFRGHTVQNSKNKAALRIEESVYEEDPVKNSDGEVIMTQYPNGKDQQVVYLGDQNRAINIRQVKNDSCEKEFSFCCSRNKSLTELEIIIKLPSYGYLIGDFIGTNGNQQVLFLPQLTTQNLEDKKLALMEMLMNCILVDEACARFLGGKYTYDLSINATKCTGEVSRTYVFTRALAKSTRENVSRVVNNEQSGVEKDWQQKVRRGVQNRLRSEMLLQRHLRDITKIKERLIYQSRSLVREISGAKPTGGPQTLETVSIRYISRRVMNENKVAVHLCLEVDMFLKGGSEQLEGNIFDVQLSCSPRTSKRAISAITTSSLLPKFAEGEVITMLASITIYGIKFRGGSLGDDDIAQLTVNAFYRDDLLQSRKKCLVVGYISIPFSSSNDLATHSCHVKAINLKQLTSTSIIDNRVPIVLTIENSESTSSNIQGDWQRIIESINSNFSCSEGVVGCHYDSRMMRTDLVIFSPSPEERLAMVETVLRCVPMSANIISTNTNSINYDCKKNKLSIFLDKEIEWESKTSSLSDCVQLLRAQCATDEIYIHTVTK